jgi:hypothetical protein
MKKLVFAMGCIAAILLTSSCTADNSEETNNGNLTTPAKDFVPRTDTSADGIDDPIPPKTNTTTDGIDDPIPPKTSATTDGIDDPVPPKN